MRKLLVSLIVILGLAGHAAGLDRCFTETPKNTVTPAPTLYAQFKMQSLAPVLADGPVVVLSTIRLCYDKVTCLANSLYPIAYLNMIWTDGLNTDNAASGFTEVGDCESVNFATGSQVTAVTAMTADLCNGYIIGFKFTVKSAAGTVTTQTIGVTTPAAGLTEFDFGVLKGPISGFAAAGKKPAQASMTSFSFLYDDCFCQQQAIATFPPISTITMVLGTPATATITKPAPLFPLEGFWTTSAQCTPVVEGQAGSHAVLVGTTLTVTTTLNEGAMIGPVTEQLLAYFPKTESTQVMIPVSYSTTAKCSTNPIQQNVAFTTTTLTTQQGGAPVSFSFAASTYSGLYTSQWSSSASAPACVMSFRLNPASGTLATLTSTTEPGQTTPSTYTVTMTATTSTPTGTTTVNVEAYWSAFPGETSVPASTQKSTTVSMVVTACDPVLVLSSSTTNFLQYKNGGSTPAIQQTVVVAGCSVSYTFQVKVNGNALYTPVTPATTPATYTNNYAWLTVQNWPNPGPTFLKIQDTTTTGATDGVYTVTIEAQYGTSPVVTSAALTWTVTLSRDQCITAKWMLGYIQPIVYQIPTGTNAPVIPIMKFNEFTYTLDGTNASTACSPLTSPLSYSVTNQVSGLPLGVYFETAASTQRVLTSTPYNNVALNWPGFTSPTMSQAGTFVIKVKACLAAFSTNCLTIDVTVRITFVCSDTIMTCASPDPYIIPLKAPVSATTFTIAQVADTISTTNGAPTSYCGARGYSLDATPIVISQTATTLPAVAFTASTRTFSITPSLTSDFGYFNVQFRVWLVDFTTPAQTSNLMAPSQPTLCQIQIQVVPDCVNAVISNGVPPVADIATPMGGSKTLIYGAFTSNKEGQYDNYCGIFSYVLTAPSSIYNAATFGAETDLSFRNEDRSIRYATSSATQYPVTLTATMVLFPTKTKVVTFKVYGVKMCMVSKVMSFPGSIQPNIVVSVGATTTTPIKPMSHTYADLWSRDGADPCSVKYRLEPQTAGASTMCNINSPQTAIICLPAPGQAGNVYTYKLVGYFPNPTPSNSADTPGASTENAVTFTVTVKEACGAITTFEPGRTIGADQRYVIGRDDQLSLPFTFAYYPPCDQLTEYEVTVWKNSQNRLTENIVLKLDARNVTELIKFGQQSSVQSPVPAGYIPLIPQGQTLTAGTQNRYFGRNWIFYDPSVPRIVIWSNSTYCADGTLGPPCAVYEDEGIYPITVEAFLMVTSPPTKSFKRIEFTATLSRSKCILTNFMTSHTFQDMYYNIQDPTKVQNPTMTQLPQIKTPTFPNPLNLSTNRMVIGGDFYSTQMWPYYTDWMTQDTQDDCGPRKYEFNGELFTAGVFTWGTVQTIDIYNLPPLVENWDNWIQVRTDNPYYADKWVMNFTVTLRDLQNYRATVFRTQLFTVWIDSECMRSKFVYSPFPDLIHRFSGGRPRVPSVTMTITDIIDEYSLTVSPFNGLAFCQGRTYTLLSVSCVSLSPNLPNTCSATNPAVIFTQTGLDSFMVMASEESQYGTYTLTFNVGYTKYQYMQDPPYNIPAYVPTLANPTPVYPAGTLNSNPQLITADKHNILNNDSKFAGPRPTIYTFTGRVVPDCQNTAWTNPVIAPMYTTVGAQVFQTIDLFTYSEQGKANSFCGPITTEVIVGQTYGLKIDSTKTLLTLAPDSTSTVGVVNAQLRATISNPLLIFPPTSSIVTFQITVYACTLTKYDAVWAYSALNPERYQLMTTLYIPFTFVKEPACNYLYDDPLKLTSLNPNNHWYEVYIDGVKQVEIWDGETKITGSWAWIDFANSRLVINTIDPHLQGSHVIKVRNWNNQQPTRVFDFVDMNVNLFVLKSDCIWTTMVGGTITNMNFEISYDQPPKSMTFPDFIDSVNQANPATDCGPRTYTITPITRGGLHTFDSATRTFTFYTNNPAHTGMTFQYSVYGKLSNWPQLEVYAKWTTTFSVIVSSRCQNTIFRFPKFPQYWVNVGVPTNLPIPVIPDSVSVLDGMGPEYYCGPRTYSISFGKFTQVTQNLQQVQYADHSAFPAPVAVISGSSMTSNPANADYVGFHQVFLTVGLANYSLLRPLSVFEFQINVNIACSDLTGPTRLYAPYNMTSSVGWQVIQQQFFNVTTFSDQVYKLQNSTSLENQYCGNKWSYAVTMANGTFAPWFLNYFYYEGKRLVTIDTPKFSDVAEYWFRYVFQNSDWPQLNSYDTFNLTISNPHKIRENLPPGFINLDWSPSYLYSEQILTMQIKFGDPDGDDVMVTYRWDGPKLKGAINKDTGLLMWKCPKFGNGTVFQSTLVVTIDDGNHRSVTKSKQIWCMYDFIPPVPVVIPPVVVPKAYNKTSTILSSITSYGLVTIQFEDPLSFGKSWASRYNRTGSDFRDILEVTFIPGNDPSQDLEGYLKNLNSFNWTLVPNSTQEGNQIQLQLNFSDPIWVSQGLYPDQLAIKFKNPDAFKNEGERVDPDTVLQWFVPCQILDNEETQYISNYFGGSSIAFKAVVGLNFLVTMAIGGSITPMIVALRSVQVISHLPMVKIKMPANTLQALGQIQSVATFNLFDTTKLDYLMYKNDNQDFIGRKLRTSFSDLKLPEDLIKKPEELDAQPLSQPNFYYERSELKNCMFISNVGLPLYVLGAYAAFMITVMQVLRLFKGVESIGKVYNWLYSKLTWSFLIIFLFETSLHSVIAALLNLQCQIGDTTNTMAYISYIFSIACLAAIGILIIGVGCLMVYSAKKNKFKDEWWKEHFGTLFRDIDTEDPWALAYPVVFLVLRVMFGCLVVLGKDMDGALQLTLLQVICFVSMVYNGWVRPIRMNPRMQTMSLINDFMTLCIVVYCGLFTDFENDPGMRYKMGWGFMGLVGLYFVANGLVILWDGYQKGYTIAGRAAFQYAVRRHLISHPNTFKDIVNPEKEAKVHDPDNNIPAAEVVQAVLLGDENPLHEDNKVLPVVEKEYVGNRLRTPSRRPAIVQILDPEEESKTAPVENGGDIELGEVQRETPPLTGNQPTVLDQADEVMMARIEDDNEPEVIDLEALQRQRIDKIIQQSNNPQFFSASKHGRIKTKGWVQPNLDLDEDQELGGRYQ